MLSSPAIHDSALILELQTLHQFSQSQRKPCKTLFKQRLKEGSRRRSLFGLLLVESVENNELFAALLNTLLYHLKTICE